MLQAWNLCGYLQAVRSCPLKDEEMVEFSKLPTSWKIILEPMIGNVVIFEVDALIYVVLSKEEKHALWGSSWYHRMHNAIAEVSDNPKLL